MHTKIVYKATLLLLLFLVGCSEQNKSHQVIRQEVARWSGKQIHLPSEAVFMRYALDTVPFTPDTEYKILMYTDSGGCTSCKLQLPKWKEMLALTDSLLPGKISYLFFFDNADLREVRYLLKQAGLDYPVCIDTGHKLNRLNNFPNDRQFQTFLLDKQNRVMAIGNPALNPAVRELYIQRMTGKKRENSSRSLTVAQVQPALIDLGKLKGKEMRTVTITVTNCGQEPLVLLEAIADCGCAEALFNHAPLPPGKSTSVEVRFTPTDTGTFTKTIRLYANVAQPILLTLRGEVVSL